jgi:TPR repeat protein
MYSMQVGKACRKRAAELHDEALFKEPPPEHGDCPICFIRLPTMDTGQKYYDCCGKKICSGCCYADVYDNLGNIIAGEKCPFCRTPVPTTDEEIIKRRKKRMELGDAYAFFLMGNNYFYGHCGMPQNSAKAVEFWGKAGKKGYANLGNSYNIGEGVERDEKKAKHYLELAAMEGDSYARHNLGANEYNACNYDRALKHYMIAVRCGDTDSVKNIQRMYMYGHATKDQYAHALQSHQAYINEIKSDQREQAAALKNDCSYY